MFAPEEGVEARAEEVRPSRPGADLITMLILSKNYTNATNAATTTTTTTTTAPATATATATATTTTTPTNYYYYYY